MTLFRKPFPTFLLFPLFILFCKTIKKKDRNPSQSTRGVLLSTLNDNTFPEAELKIPWASERVRRNNKCFEFETDFSLPFFFFQIHVQIFQDALMFNGNCFHASKESFCIMECKKYLSLSQRREKSVPRLYYSFNPANTSDNRYYWAIQHQY